MIEDTVLDERTYNYLVDHNELFPALTPESKKAAKTELDKSNTTPYLDKMIEVSGYVVEITKEQIDANTTIAEIHIIDENDNSIVGAYFSSTGDILDDDYVTIRGVPTAQYYFDNVSGGTTKLFI